MPKLELSCVTEVLLDHGMGALRSGAGYAAGTGGQCKVCVMELQAWARVICLDEQISVSDYPPGTRLIRKLLIPINDAFSSDDARTAALLPLSCYTDADCAEGWVPEVVYRLITEIIPGVLETAAKTWGGGRMASRLMEAAEILATATYDNLEDSVNQASELTEEYVGWLEDSVNQASELTEEHVGWLKYFVNQTVSWSQQSGSEYDALGHVGAAITRIANYVSTKAADEVLSDFCRRILQCISEEVE